MRGARQCHHTESTFLKHENSLLEVMLTAAGPHFCLDHACQKIRFTGIAIPACLIRRALSAKTSTHQQSQHHNKTPLRLKNHQRAILAFRWRFSNLTMQKCSGISSSQARLLELRILAVQLHELNIPLQCRFPSPSSPKGQSQDKACCLFVFKYL